jgi:hypothetical protein
MGNTCFSFSSAASRSAERFLRIASLLLLFALPAPAAEEKGQALPEVSLNEVSRNAGGQVYQIGDRILLEFRLPNGISRPGETVRVAGDEGKALEGWYLDPSSQAVGGAFRFIVSPVKTGELELPPLRVLREDGTACARTAPLRIKAEGPNPPENSEPELVSVLPISLSWLNRLLMALLGLAAIAGAVGLIHFSRSKKEKLVRSTPPVVPVESAEQVALRRIEQLFSLHPWTPGSLKPVSFGCSEALKDFFSARFGVEASESTTPEMLRLLQSVGMSREQLGEIRSLFELLDLVKFTSEENTRHLGEADHARIRVESERLVRAWGSVPAPEVKP